MNYPSDRLRRVLFLDIETASQEASFDNLTKEAQSHWKSKSRRHVAAEDYPYFDEELASLYDDKAAIYAEFGRVICVSVGVLYIKDKHYRLKTRTFVNSNEKVLLEDFSDLLNEHFYDRHNHFLCGHNIKEFDIPFLCRRMMILGLPLPNLLNIVGYKPWQTHHLLDTMEMWKFGDYKHYTSLDLLCHILNVPTSKNELSGAQVNQAFWEGRIDEIVTYCEKDVVATVRVYQRCIGQEFINNDSIDKSEEE